MSSKFEPIFAQIDEAIRQAKGEVFNFTNNNKKKSVAIARKNFLIIRKACNAARKELQEMKAILPTRRRTLSPETKAKMQASRDARKAAKTPKIVVSVEKA